MGSCHIYRSTHFSASCQEGNPSVTTIPGFQSIFQEWHISQTTPATRFVLGIYAVVWRNFRGKTQNPEAKYQRVFDCIKSRHAPMAIFKCSGRSSINENSPPGWSSLHVFIPNSATGPQFPPSQGQRGVRNAH